tara:strand:+ start:365 stop:1039 length:675 start_codon:yes stop_codon:yes gene_type:complete
MDASVPEKPKFVLYRRVSSSQQAKSGLGLGAQEQEIRSYLTVQHSYEVVADLVEVESGKDHQNRPVLQEAMNLAARTNSVILVSRLCRLSRDLEFIAGLMKSSTVKFRIATNPTADELSIGIYAVMGLHERKEIGRRTRQALAVAKARGVKLGTAGAQNIKKANEAKKQLAKSFASKIKPLVEPLREGGKTYQEIANILNSMGMTTTTGKSFFPSTVQRYVLLF